VLLGKNMLNYLNIKQSLKNAELNLEQQATVLPATILATNGSYKVSDQIFSEGGKDGIIKYAMSLQDSEQLLVKIKEKSLKEMDKLGDIFALFNEYSITLQYNKLCAIDYKEIIDKEKGVVTSYQFMKRIPGVTMGKFDFDAISDGQKKQVITNLLHELFILAKLGIVHNDMNTSNIIIDDSLNVTFIDFAESYFENNGYINGVDLDAICEILIEDLEISSSYPEMHMCLSEDWEKCGNLEEGFRLIPLNELKSFDKFQFDNTVKKRKLTDNSTSDDLVQASKRIKVL